MAVRTEQNGKVTTVIISRQEVRNAVDRPTAEALADAFREFEANDSACAAVLWGEGANFCAGADLKALGSERTNRTEEEGDAPMGPTRMELSKPVIAAIAGHAVAGGLELAAWCDMRVVEKSAVFGVYCRRWGVPLIDGGTVRLPRLIGLSRAMDMILTGRPVYSEEALLWGLANRVVENGASKKEAEKLAAALAEFPQTCMRGDRLSAYEQYGLSYQKALKNEFKRGMISIESAELLDGVKNFVGGKGRHGEFE